MPPPPPPTTPPPARPHIFELTPDTLRDQAATLGMPAFRAGQILDWVYRQGVADPAAMTNLPAPDRQKLADALTWIDGTVTRHQTATDDTEKLLITWPPPEVPPEVSPEVSPARPTVTAAAPEAPPEAPPESPPEVTPARPEVTAATPGISPASSQPLPVLGGASPELQTECVMIPSRSRDSGRLRRTACVSSQVGCPVGCKFCASGLGGLDGNLTAGQIVQQVWQLARLPGIERISHVVFMGMGEPMSNFDAVTRAARIMTAPWGLGISARRITVSTVGVPAGIRRLADIDLPLTLAISLHAPNDTIRRQIIPWAQYVSVEQLVEAGRYYFAKTGREVTLEYILLGGLNDQPEHARELAAVARRLRSNINLIRYNEVADLPYLRPVSGDVHAFQEVLRQAGVNAHIRASRGRDIAAACGQLRHEHAQQTG